MTLYYFPFSVIIRVYLLLLHFCHWNVLYVILKINIIRSQNFNSLHCARCSLMHYFIKVTLRMVIIWKIGSRFWKINICSVYYWRNWVTLNLWLGSDSSNKHFHYNPSTSPVESSQHIFTFLSCRWLSNFLFSLS